MIKDQYRRGVTISDLARETGHDRKTIRSVVAGDMAAHRHLMAADEIYVPSIVIGELS